ncbi:membrane-bound lytic murein transglycosylase B [Paracoccus isoporae]|uniref:Membrane-bound lytic murein transglycosylase B n=1 Tax=Paracoccus isoporae TaxID=591205 RepID=A0A1G7E5A4_9RHOB|nr:lytic murein transglycosylase [Paracoccus isoporae]SDE58646.1 membrane-bound lytic murein transglycosylase B [Paracoccus isoporae]
MSRTITRLTISAAAIAILSACATAPVGSVSTGSSVTPEPIPQASPASEAGLQNWIQGFRSRALASGISAGTYDNAMRIARYNPEVIRLDRRQAEFNRPVWEYLDSAASDSRTTKGRGLARTYGGTLASIEGRYGVDRNIVMAIWGMESNFGGNRGKMQIIPSLATLAYDGRRGEMFSRQLIAALKIIQAGDVDPAGMLGSWAGAMGHTQFMPTSYLEYAVDFTGDGRRDIWSDDPTDSLASTAAYLNRSGWVPGLPAVVEVRLPQGFNYGQTGRSNVKSGSAWSAQGVRSVSGQSLPSGGIIAPAGRSGPAFLVTRNFMALRAYNASDNYSLGVAMLANRISGGPGIVGSFPREAGSLTHNQKEEVQRLLNRLGYNVGEPDGAIGENTIAGIKAFQRRIGVEPDGYANTTLLQHLQRAT